MKRLPPAVSAALLRLGLLLALLCLIGSGSVQAAGSGKSAAVDSRFGVVEAWRQAPEATALGVGWERLTMFWRCFQPHGPAEWDASATGHDGYINQEVAAGRQLVGELINTPDWAAANPALHGNSIPKGLYLPYDDPGNYWGHFVGLMAKHYAGRIDDWVIWNEVTILTGKYATWSGSARDYAQLVRVAYQAAHHANAKARIILFGDPYWYDHGAFFRQLLTLLQAMPQSAASHGFFDVANLHLYNRPADYITVIALYRQWLAQHGWSQKPIWIGETNAVPYNDPVRTYPKAGFFSTLDDQASYVVEAFALGLALNVQRMELNRMIDGTDFVRGGEPFGLLRNDLSRRPEYAAYGLVTSLFRGVTGGVVRASAASGLYEVELHRAGQTIIVAWNQKPVPMPLYVPASTATARLYVRDGSWRPVAASAGQYAFSLSPATDNSNSADAHDYVMGGTPIILVQGAG